MSESQNMEDPCDCYEPDCPECSQRAADQEEKMEMAEHYRAIEEQEERDSQRSLEGGDDDDWDEEDVHGSRPIDEPDGEDGD